MTIERLHLAPGAMAYDAMLAAEHVARYAFAASLCRGRRVLDVACGEGYGSAMMAAAGAAHVLGIDIAETAVMLARARFGRDGVTFRVGDAAQLHRVLGGEDPFDLIVSLGTLERLEDPRAFLQGLRAALAPGGGIVIGAANGTVAAPDPLRRHAYTLDDFRAATEAVLGEADAIWLGAPMEGYGMLPVASPLRGSDSQGLDAMLRGEPAEACHILPAERAQRVDPDGASCFMAAWGVRGAITIAAAPVVSRARVEAQRALDGLRAENARLLREHGAAPAGAPPSDRELRERIADYQRAALLDAQRLQAARDALAAAQTEVARIAAERDRQVGGGAEPGGEAARLRAALAEREAMLAAIEASRSWRVLRAYGRLYDLPIIGPPLRAVRRGVGAVLRELRGG